MDFDFKGIARHLAADVKASPDTRAEMVGFAERWKNLDRAVIDAEVDAAMSRGDQRSGLMAALAEAIREARVVQELRPAEREQFAAEHSGFGVQGAQGLEEMDDGDPEEPGTAAALAAHDAAMAADDARLARSRRLTQLEGARAELRSREGIFLHGDQAKLAAIEAEIAQLNAAAEAAVAAERQARFLRDEARVEALERRREAEAEAALEAARLRTGAP